MSRFKTPRQRAAVLAGMTAETTPIMLTDQQTLYEPAASLKSFWRMPQ